MRKPLNERTTEEHEVIERLAYYRHLQERGEPVTIVARPAPVAGNSLTERKGKFKKGSNLNHALVRLNLKLRQIMGVSNGAYVEGLSRQIQLLMREGASYREALAKAQSMPEYAQTFVIGKPLLFYEISLILDKDSIVPTGVSRRALTEFVHNPKLSYIQMGSEPSNLGASFFSMMIGQKTLMIFRSAFRTSSMLGSLVPFVGHNGYIRTSSLIEQGGWSENRVSEDFTFALREAVKHGPDSGLYVEYADMPFQEQVSETLGPEAAKLRRYGYGIMEMVFEQPRDWFKKGILTADFKNMIKSRRLTLGMKLAVMSWFLNIMSLGLTFFYMIFSTAFFGGIMPIAAVIYIVLGASVLKYYGLLPSGGVTVTIKNIYIALRNSLLYGAVLVSELSYQIIHGIFSFIYAEKPVFPPTNLEIAENKSLRQAAKEIPLVTHIKAVVALAVSSLKIWLISIGVIGTQLGWPVYRDMLSLFGLIILPYTLDMTLMYSVRSYVVSLFNSGTALITFSSKPRPSLFADQEAGDDAQLTTVSAKPGAKAIMGQRKYREGGVDFSDWSVLQRSGHIVPFKFHFSKLVLDQLDGFGFKIKQIVPLNAAMLRTEH